jgi:hypothetical protein
MSKMNHLILIEILLCAAIWASEGAVSPAQKQQLIDSHNKFRREVAQGKHRPQPEAANMLELVSCPRNRYS